MSKTALIYGGRGALGSALVTYFKSHGWWVISVDLVANDLADANIVVDPNSDWNTQEKVVLSGVAKYVPDGKLDAVLNVAGGWAGGAADSADLVKNCDLMWKQSVWSSVISAAVGAKHLRSGGCLVLPGAKAALNETPGMIGYGMAKAAIHQLVSSLAAQGSGLPDGTFVSAILPVTLDTPMNRKFMPDADFSTWTSLEFIADLLWKWSEDLDRPSSGSLIQLITTNHTTTLVHTFEGGL